VPQTAVTSASVIGQASVVAAQHDRAQPAARGHRKRLADELGPQQCTPTVEAMVRLSAAPDVITNETRFSAEPLAPASLFVATHASL